MVCTKCHLGLLRIHTLVEAEGKELRFCPACGAPTGELDQLQRRLAQHQRNLWDLIRQRSVTPFVVYLNRQIEDEQEVVARLEEAIAQLEPAKPLTKEDRSKRLLLELEARRKDLRRLEERKAKWGMDAPIGLLNEIDEAREDIARLTAEIQALGS